MNIWKRIFHLLCVCTLLSVNAAQAADAAYNTAPPVNEERKWRIVYYQGGEYIDYYQHLAATVEGLMQLGWIKQLEIPDAVDKNTTALWSWLVQEAESEYIEFVEDGFYTANWNRENRSDVSSALIDRLNTDQDADMVIAMGTWAGKDLVNNLHDTQTIVMSTSDPVSSGLIPNNESSGFNHVFVRVDPDRYKRQVSLFHDLIGFEKLGVAYENSLEGRSYAAIDLVKKMGEERGFEVFSCYTQSDIADQKLAGKTVIDCFEDLVKTVDAIYVTAQGGVNVETIPELVRIANRSRIPTFSQYGQDEVKYGYLLSLSRPEGLKPEGVFLAKIIAQIFNGAMPGQLNQVYADTSSIVLNLKTAELIGLYLNADVLAAADQIYWQIEEPQE